MNIVGADAFLPLAEAYSLGALDEQERDAFERHLAGCGDCHGAVESANRAIPGLVSSLPQVSPRGALRSQLLDLAGAPRWPLDLSALSWEDLAPGIRRHTIEEQPERGLRKCLVWAQPGARNATHRHGGDECILVLEGGLKDERGEYHAGELCRSRQGSIHSEEVLPGEDCVCFVVYYGPLEFL